MGEYAKRLDEVEIKIGTCESMYYLRYEDRLKVLAIQNSLNPATTKNLFWRLPFPDEDTIPIGQYGDYHRGERLYDSNSLDYKLPESPTGILQMHHQSGLLINVECYHGNKLPEGSKDISVAWNGKSFFSELAHIKNTENGILPIVRCRFCDEIWRSTWENVLPFLHGEMKVRLEKYKTAIAV